MGINPFENQNKVKSNKKYSDDTLSNLTVKSKTPQKDTDKYDEYLQNRNQFYKTRFDSLNTQIEDFQRKANRDKYLKKFIEKDSEEIHEEKIAISEEDEKGNIVVRKEKIIINNPGNGCSSGCNPFGWLKNLRCCGCLFLIIFIIISYFFLLSTNKFTQSFTLENIIPQIVGDIDQSKLPDPRFFSVSDRLKSEIERVNKSPNSIETITIYEPELNTYITETEFSIYGYTTEQYVDLVDSKMYIYLKRKGKNDSWTVLTIQSDKLGKPQLISFKHGKYEISGEFARNFLNNLPMYVGNINIEKLDEKFSKILFPDENYRIDKVVFLENKAELSLIRK